MTQNTFSLSPYLKNLQSDSEKFQIAIESLLEKYQVQPVGDGFIDLILDKNISLALIQEFTKLHVAVERLTWWCHVTSETKNELGCPHGMGGPQDVYSEGWFSECVGYSDFVVLEFLNPLDENSMPPEIFTTKCNELVTNYIKNTFPFEGFYSPCLYVGLWLRVPDDWKRKYYWA
jgi:hypothetical protein